MNSSARFTVSIHTLALLALSRDKPVTSEYIAGSVNTNPVVIRRLLSRLRKAHLVTSQGGNGGGWRLVSDPETTTLRDVYRAVEDESIFALHNRLPNQQCPVGAHIGHTLTRHFAEADEALGSQLARTTLADVLGEVLARVG